MESEDSGTCPEPDINYPWSYLSIIEDNIRSLLPMLRSSKTTNYSHFSPEDLYLTIDYGYVECVINDTKMVVSLMVLFLFPEIDIDIKCAFECCGCGPVVTSVRFHNECIILQDASGTREIASPCWKHYCYICFLCIHPSPGQPLALWTLWT